MILYVNGCSHSAGTDAAVKHAWAVDDAQYWDRGDEAHPANLAVSYGKHIADALGAELICQASSGGSNDRITRTTTQWIENNRDCIQDTFMILQWSTWEREEWFHNGKWYQVNASGIDHVPPEFAERYRDFVINVDWDIKTSQAHDKIWQMHLYLKSLGVRHLFFSGQSTFSSIQNQHDWGPNYIYPYIWEESYHNWLKNNGGAYASEASYHFDAKSHRLWADHVLQYINDNNLIEHHEIRTD
jgi:hypothetical protein